MIFFSSFWVFRYAAKMSRRGARLPGFPFKFLAPRFLKAIITLPIVPFFFCSLIFFRKNKTIIYRPDYRHLDIFSNLKNILVIGDFADRSWAKKNGYDFIFFHPFYSLSFFGLGFCWRLAFIRIRPKRILFSTDYGLDQYLSIEIARRLHIYSWCFQHGLFPSQNNNDLDGFDCDVNFVSSKFQSNILKRSGYKGKVKICDQLFFNENSAIDSKISWESNGRPVIFVGCGYSFNPDLELKIVDLLTNLKNILEPRCKIIYRPHPRDKNILKKIEAIGVPCEFGKATSFLNKQNFVFIGIKSTFLYEAQNAGRKVFLLISDDFPRYFDRGEIALEINTNNLNLILDEILN